jgi:hypothetical protein
MQTDVKETKREMLDAGFYLAWVAKSIRMIISIELTIRILYGSMKCVW